METIKHFSFNADKEFFRNSILKKISETALILLLIFVLSILTLSASNPSTNPPGRDGGFFLYVGKSIQSGAKLYVDIWDSKGPLIFWINALGVGSDYSRWGIFLIELIFWATALLISYWTLKRHYGLLPALGTLFVGSHLLNQVIGSGNFTEEYSLLFTWIAIAALALLISKHKKTFWPFFMMGVSFVLNFLLRANNIGTQAIVIVGAFLYVFSKRKETKLSHALIYLFIGALTIAVPSGLFFVSNGTFKAMIDASIIYNFAYSTARGNSFSNSLVPAINAFKGWFFVFLLIWALAIKHLISNRKQKMFDPLLLVTVFAFPMEVFMSSISGRGYGHYFICWIPAYMLLIAFGLSIAQIEVINDNFRTKCETKHYLLILLFLVLISLGGSYSTLFNTGKFIGASIIRPNINREYREPVAKVVNSLTSNTDKVLVFAGQAGINIMSQRDSINGALFYPAINNSKIGLEVQDKFFMNLRADPPLLILDGHSFHPEQIPAIDPETRNNQRFLVNFSENLEQVMSWINQHYERYDEANGYIIYRLRNCSQ